MSSLPAHVLVLHPLGTEEVSTWRTECGAVTGLAGLVGNLLIEGWGIT
jgi:hypothetical protein